MDRKFRAFIKEFKFFGDVEQIQKNLFKLEMYRFWGLDNSDKLKLTRHAMNNYYLLILLKQKDFDVWCYLRW